MKCFTFLFFISFFQLATLTFAQPSNDEICNARFLIPRNNCNYQIFDNTGATTDGLLEPICWQNQSNDIWFKTIVPVTGDLKISTISGTISTLFVIVYQADSCDGNLNVISYNHLAEPLSANPTPPPTPPTFELIDLPRNQEIFIRVMDYYRPPFFLDVGDPLEEGTFGICVQKIMSSNNFLQNSVCSDTLMQMNECSEVVAPICNFDGLSGTTMGFADNAWDSLEDLFCFTIENNSYIQFIAPVDSIELIVTVSDTIGPLSCDDGLQFFIFSVDTCGGVPTHIQCETNLSIGVHNVTIDSLQSGGIYYLMFDGFGGDVCNYELNVISPQNYFWIVAEPEFCLGDTVFLNTFGTDTSIVNWSGNSINSANSQNTFAILNTPGTFLYTATASNLISPAGYLIDSIYITVHDPNFNITYSNDHIPCSSFLDSVQVSTNGAYFYNWISSYQIEPNYGPTVNIDGNDLGPYILVASDTNGCFLLDTFLLQVPTSGILDTSVNLLNEYLVATVDSISYQWVDCNNSFLPFLNDTNKFFNPPNMGSFAVIVESGTCKDTSFCHFHNGCNDLLINITSVLHPTSGNSDGEVEFIGYGGTPLYNYLWEDGYTDSVRIQLDSGSYSINILDQNMCTGTRIIYLYEQDTSIISSPPIDTIVSSVLDICIPFTYSSSYIYDYYEDVNGDLIVRWVFLNSNNEVFIQSVNYGTFPIVSNPNNILFEINFSCQSGIDNTKFLKSHSDNIFFYGGNLNTVHHETLNYKLYPNPTNGKVLLEFNQNLGTHEVLIKSVAGQILRTYKFHQAKNQLHLDFSPGTYFIEIHTERGTYVEQIIRL